MTPITEERVRTIATEVARATLDGLPYSVDFTALTEITIEHNYANCHILIVIDRDSVYQMPPTAIKSVQKTATFVRIVFAQSESGTVTLYGR